MPLPADPADLIRRAGRGVLVVSATQGGPAARAGLQAHDVLTAIDGVEGVTDESLRTAVKGKKPGDTMQVRILRRGKTSELAIEVGKQTPASWWTLTWQEPLLLDWATVMQNPPLIHHEGSKVPVAPGQPYEALRHTSGSTLAASRPSARRPAGRARPCSQSSSSRAAFMPPVR